MRRRLRSIRGDSATDPSTTFIRAAAGDFRSAKVSVRSASVVYLPNVNRSMQVAVTSGVGGHRAVGAGSGLTRWHPQRRSGEATARFPPATGIGMWSSRQTSAKLSPTTATSFLIDRLRRRSPPDDYKRRLHRP